MKKDLSLIELIAIAIGAMVGGGIFTILGVAVSQVGFLAPFAIALGGVLAFFAAYSYVKLGTYYLDEGATYAFFKKTYPSSKLAASFIGWFTVFGYISTLALYAYTFSSYAISGFEFANSEIIRKIVAIVIILVFAIINLISVKGMGKLEDILVYLKLLILLFISIVLIYFSKIDFNNFLITLKQDFIKTPFLNIIIVTAITFVAYEGFQLVINAVKDMQDPKKNIPRAIYSAVIIVALIYFIIALGAVLSIPLQDLIKNKEYALASGAEDILGSFGKELVVFGALLATSSAISGTLFGASRQLARIADDGYLPKIFTKRVGTIPTNAIIAMALTSITLIISGTLRLILEFGSITFLLVSLLMAIANFKIKDKTNSHPLMAIISISGLSIGAILILYYEFKTNINQLYFILIIYLLLTIGAFIYAKAKNVT
jgi:amino acid transporter